LNTPQEISPYNINQVWKFRHTILIRYEGIQEILRIITRVKILHIRTTIQFVKNNNYVGKIKDIFLQFYCLNLLSSFSWSSKQTSCNSTNLTCAFYNSIVFKPSKLCFYSPKHSKLLSLLEIMGKNWMCSNQHKKEKYRVNDNQIQIS